MARVPEIVVDASIVCKWFLPEGGSEHAMVVRDAHAEGQVRILAPELLCYEVANALRYHPRLSTEDLADSIQAMFDFQISFRRSSPEFLRAATQLARQRKLTVYDACYVTLAETRSCPLISADSRILGASERAIQASEWPSRP